jgi:hypothetical protein
MIKENLVDLFCEKTGQERPSLSYGKIKLFPDMTQSKLDSLFRSDRPGCVRFYKNILESKSVCAPVGNDMISEAYDKHYESLCRPEGQVLDVPQEYLQKLFQYGKNVGKFVRQVYRPNRTKLPNTRATVEKSRMAGGAREALSANFELQKGPLHLSLMEGVSRLEPYVIGLFGEPGCGKTTTVVRLVSFLHASLFPGAKREELVYSRSCSSKYWDGYKGQPIVIMDDIGQDVVDRSDLVEFEQLVSVNPYVLPMAHLEEKGRKFTSPIIITTSNMVYASSLRNIQGFTVEDERAFWRRFHCPILVNRNYMVTEIGEGISARTSEPSRYFLASPRWQVRVETFGQHFRDYRRQPLPKTENILPSFHRGLTTAGYYLYEDGFPGITEMGCHIVKQFRSHVDFHDRSLSGQWRQVISCFNARVNQSLAPFYTFRVKEKDIATDPEDVTVSVSFPEFPPFHPPRVDAVAIPEPLKVRMITKAEGETKCLQPFQRALFQYLKSRPQFSLTHGVSWSESEEFSEKLEWIYRIQGEIESIRSHEKSGDLWLSGDYTAATDNFPLSVTNALVEGILSQIDHEPTKAWVRYEVSPHIIRYPDGREGQQTSGQLMGSLLSFPLLCFLNDFIVSESGFEEGKYRINGDDVVALGPQSVIDAWRKNAPKVGLDLSIGKNFIDPHFCCVNSQLFYDGKVQHTGKVSLQTRFGKTLSRCFCESQFYYGLSEELRSEFIRRNIVELRKSPRSLDIPVTHGGLGLLFSGRPGVDWKLATRVYIRDYLQPFSSSQPVPGFDYLRALRVPVGIFSDDELELGGGEAEENKIFDTLLSLNLDPADAVNSELTTVGFHQDEKKYFQGDNERPINQLIHLPLKEFPDLGTLRTKVVFIQKHKVGFLKQRVQYLALRLLVDHIRNGGSNLDPEEEFVEIQRSVLEQNDPLFSDDFPFSIEELTEEEYDRYTAPFSDLESTFAHSFYERLSNPPLEMESLHQRLMSPSVGESGPDSPTVSSTEATRPRRSTKKRG